MRLVFVLGLMCCLVVLEGESADDCKAVASGLLKQHMKTVNDCTAALKFKDAKEKKLKSSCIMKCVMTRAGLLDASGKVDIPASLKILKESLPEDQYPKIEAALTPCQNFIKDLDNNDELCKSYDPMIKCGTQAFTQLCK